MTDESYAARIAKRRARWAEMRKFGERPKPRALLWRFDDPIGEVADMFPTVVETDELDRVDQREFDVLLSHPSADLLNVDANLYLLGFGALRFPRPHPPTNDIKAYPIGFTEWTVSKELGIPADLPDPIADLVEKQLIPKMLAADNNPALGFFPRAPGEFPSAWMLANPQEFTPEKLRENFPDVVEPFVVTKSGGEILAGRFRRSGDRAECWCLPKLDPLEAARWVGTALEIWSDEDPKRFPVHTDWEASPEWRTPVEEGPLQELAGIERRRRAVLKELAAAEADAQSRLESATVEAAEDRKILTATGADLARAVKACFESFKFSVVDADADATPGDLLEDLQVEDSGWVALVEVTGIRGGAKVGDLGRFNRRLRRFADKYHRSPNAQWYVVNQFRGRNPATRPPALSTNEPELKDFAEEAGLVVDTSDLFRLWKEVASGRVPPDEARRLLRESTGRFSFVS